MNFFIKNDEKINEIIKNLYIGNINIANDKNYLIENKFDVIINCSKDIPNFFENDNLFRYYRVPVNDTLQEKDFIEMYRYFPNIVQIIDDNLNNDKKILVHCFLGMQRSPCVVAAYLLYKYKLSIHDIIQLILNRRPCAFHYGRNINFYKSLYNYKYLLDN